MLIKTPLGIDRIPQQLKIIDLIDTPVKILIVKPSIRIFFFKRLPAIHDKPQRRTFSPHQLFCRANMPSLKFRNPFFSKSMYFCFVHVNSISSTRQ